MGDDDSLIVVAVATDDSRWECSRDAGLWKYVAVSVCGASHTRIGKPCQDRFQIQVFDDLIVAIASDGAGTAELSGKGAEILGEAFVELAEADIVPLREALAGDPLAWVRMGIERARSKCVQLLVEADGDEIDTHGIRSFNATLVGCVADQTQGFLFHIGDGLGAALESDGTVTYSYPKNGEYSNETFFFTEADWSENLSIIRFGPFSEILLMSDGVTPFALASNKQDLEQRFVTPLLNYLRATPDSDDRLALALRATLASERANEISGDDKTLVWLSRRTGRS